MLEMLKGIDYGQEARRFYVASPTKKAWMVVRATYSVLMAALTAALVIGWVDVFFGVRHWAIILVAGFAGYVSLYYIYQWTDWLSPYAGDNDK